MRTFNFMFHSSQTTLPTQTFFKRQGTKPVAPQLLQLSFEAREFLRGIIGLKARQGKRVTPWVQSIPFQIAQKIKHEMLQFPISSSHQSTELKTLLAEWLFDVIWAAESAKKDAQGLYFWYPKPGRGGGNFG